MLFQQEGATPHFHQEWMNLANFGEMDWQEQTYHSVPHLLDLAPGSLNTFFFLS
jgi:hypothetical protein